MAYLGDLCDIASGGTPSRARPEFYGEGIPWVKIGDLSQGVVLSTTESITEQGLANSAAKIFPAQTVLISIFATIGRTATLGIDAATNQAIAGLTIRDHSVIDASYLRRYLDSTVGFLESLARGVAQPNINLGILKRLEIPLPSLTEQRRIAAILDQADALRVKRREALAQLDHLTQAIFIDMFGDPVGNPRQWPNAAVLGDVADIVSGVTKGRRLNGADVRPVPYLAVANVQDKSLNLSIVKEIEATEDEITRYRMQKNDLLLTEGGDPDKLGRGTLWQNELPECIHQNHIFRVRLKSDEIHPVFLNWLVGSERGKKYFLRSAKQTTGIASINMTQLRGFPLLVPPMPLQLDFASRLEDLASIRSRQTNALEAVDGLFTSLQHRAFRGEL